MGQSKQERYETARKDIQKSQEIAPQDRPLILDYLDAADPNHLLTQLPGGETKKPGTLHQHANSISRVAKDLHHEGNSLAECSTRDINALMGRYLKGTVPSCKDSGLSNGTVNNRQGPLRVFYRFHDGLNVEPEKLTMLKLGDTSVDEDDMFTKDEVHRMREAAKITGTRDICLVDLLLYTGQRISAILHLRLKDVDVDEGTFRLNTDDGDLKGAKGKRPLLGAQKSARDWKRQHPTGNPDDYLITSKVGVSGRDDVIPGGRLSSAGVHRILTRVGEIAGVEKPVNAHNFRHYFVTVCKRDYDMDNDRIKRLIGHRPGSKVMESTYSHLSDEDVIEYTEEKWGIREPKETSPLTPPVCDRCSEPLDGEWKSCPYCGMDYAPSVLNVEETAGDIQADMVNDAFEGRIPDAERAGAQAIEKYIRENPDELAKYLAESMSQSDSENTGAS